MVDEDSFCLQHQFNRNITPLGLLSLIKNVKTLAVTSSSRASATFSSSGPYTMKLFKLEIYCEKWLFTLLGYELLNVVLEIAPWSRGWRKCRGGFYSFGGLEGVVCDFLHPMFV